MGLRSINMVAPAVTEIKQRRDKERTHATVPAGVPVALPGSKLADYKIDKCISTTDLSQVFLAEDKKGRSVALKKISLLRVAPDLIKNELNAGLKLSHPNVAKLLDSFTEGLYTYLSFEYIKGDDLLQHMVNREWKPLKEKDAKFIFKQIVKSLSYCHVQGIIHHDVKLENVLLTKRGKVKLIDFGLCESVSSCTRRSTRWCGSFDYVSPEILLKTPYCGCKSDVFSLGTVLYSILFAQLPFDFKERVCELIYNGNPHPKLHFPQQHEHGETYRVSEAAKDLLSKMMHPEEEKRISMEDLATHPWLRKSSKLPWSL